MRSITAVVAAAALLLAAPAARAQTTAFAPAALEEVATGTYFDDSHEDLTQALAWIQETNALHPEYHTVYAEARIRLQLKDYAGAHATAAEAKKLALAAAQGDYARRSAELMAQAQACLR